MRPVMIAYEILKNLKGWKLRSLDEQGQMCMIAGGGINADPKFEYTLRKIVEWYNKQIA